MSGWTTTEASSTFRLGASLLGLAIPFAWLWSVDTPSEQAFRLERGAVDSQFVESAQRVLTGRADPALAAFDRGLEDSCHLLPAGERYGPVRSGKATTKVVA